MKQALKPRPCPAIGKINLVSRPKRLQDEIDRPMLKMQPLAIREPTRRRLHHPAMPSSPAQTHPIKHQPMSTAWRVATAALHSGVNDGLQIDAMADMAAKGAIVLKAKGEFDRRDQGRGRHIAKGLFGHVQDIDH